MGLWVIVQQIVIGVAIGLTMQMAFAAVRHAGEVIGLQMGLSFCNVLRPNRWAKYAYFGAYSKFNYVAAFSLI